MNLTCEKCGRSHPLTDEDIVLFHPRFFCLSCGARVPFPVNGTRLEELRKTADRERRLPDAAPQEGPETMRIIKPPPAPPPSGQMDGG